MVAYIVRAAQRHQVAPGLWRWLHVIQKRIHALNQVYAVLSSPAIKLLQPGRAGFVRNEDIRRKLYHYHVVRIIGTVLSHSDWYSPDRGPGKQQCGQAPPIKFTGKLVHQAMSHLKYAP